LIDQLQIRTTHHTKPINNELTSRSFGQSQAWIARSKNRIDQHQPARDPSGTYRRANQPRAMVPRPKSDPSRTPNSPWQTANRRVGDLPSSPTSHDNTTYSGGRTRSGGRVQFVAEVASPHRQTEQHRFATDVSAITGKRRIVAPARWTEKTESRPRTTPTPSKKIRQLVTRESGRRPAPPIHIPINQRSRAHEGLRPVGVSPPLQSPIDKCCSPRVQAKQGYPFRRSANADAHVFDECQT